MNEEPIEAEVEAKEEKKPIGGNEVDLEAILVDGILGFSLSFGNAIIFIIRSITNANTFSEGAFILVLSAVVAALIFKIVQISTDAISALNPRVFYVCCHAVCFLMALVALYLQLYYLCAVAAAIGLADTLILYGRFLSALARKALLLVVDSAFLYPGILLMVIINIPSTYSVVILSAMVLVTIFVVLLFIRRPYDFGDLISAEDSRNRSIKVKGNVHTLFLAGFMAASLLLVRPLPLPTEIILITLGFSFAVASIASLVLRQINERRSKDALRKSFALIATILLLPLAVVPPEVGLALLACFTCFTVLTVLIILDAIVETVRFNFIAAMWLLGKECSVFFFGLAVGSAMVMSLPCLSEYVGSEHATLFLCFTTVIICAWLQIKVNYQIYPYEPSIEEPVDEEVAENIKRNGRRKALWHQKIDAACEQFRLSPREREILPILLRGRDARYIMDTFYISQSTAKTHIYNIYRKFGIHSRQELLDFVEEIDFLDFDDDVDETLDVAIETRNTMH